MNVRALTFFSLTESNEAIASVMQRMNACPMRHLGVSRRELFEPGVSYALWPPAVRLTWRALVEQAHFVRT